MTDFANYTDGDGFTSHIFLKDPLSGPASQNGIFFTGLRFCLDPNQDPTQILQNHFDKHTWKRNSSTKDIVSYDDLYVLLRFVPSARAQFLAQDLWHPGRPDDTRRWHFARNPCFIDTIRRPDEVSIIRDLAIATSGFFEKGSSTFLLAFLIARLYPCRHWAFEQLLRNSAARYPGVKQSLDNIATPGNINGALAEYFGKEHPLVSLAIEKGF